MHVTSFLAKVSLKYRTLIPAQRGGNDVGSGHEILGEPPTKCPHIPFVHFRSAERRFGALKFILDLLKRGK